MTIWWGSLTLLERIAACIACPATLVLVIQTVMQLFGLGGGLGDDVDIYDDGYSDETGGDNDTIDSGVRFFTVRGFVTFFTIFGWGFLALSRSGTSQALAIIVAVLLGIGAMILSGFILYWSMKLQSDGTVNFQNAIGMSGRVYVPIPSSRKGMGKVNVLIQERFCECEAVTDEEKSIETDSEVLVTGITGRNTLIVRRKQPVNII